MLTLLIKTIIIEMIKMLIITIIIMIVIMVNNSSLQDIMKMM